MALGLPTAVRNAITNAYTATVDNGPAGGTLAVRTGAKPALPNDPESGTLLVTFTFEVVSFGAPVNGTATLDNSPVITAVAVASGLAGWARIKDSNLSFRGDVTVGGPGSGADVIMNDPNIVSGSTIRIVTGTVTTPTGG